MKMLAVSPAKQRAVVKARPRIAVRPSKPTNQHAARPATIKTLARAARVEKIPSTASAKLFYRIQEAAQMTGLRPSVLRYWETEFRELHPEKDAADQRRYRQEDIEVVQAIRKLLYEDRFTIKGARSRLREELRRRRQEREPATPAPAKQFLGATPSLTEFRLSRPEGGNMRKRQLDQSLRK